MSGLEGSAATRSRLRILTPTLAVWREGVQIASVHGRVVPVGAEGGAYAPVERPIDGLAGLRSSHLGLLEGTVDVQGGDEVRANAGASVYYVQGVTAWQGLTACALEQVR